ncbi:TonB-dependent receptor [Novosphingobium piscinae]|uniref:TonB-dependent siderophore receptor n=1 Tax=Novosphingobium piscinae TaxID=1507448 RepID=A0A7X1G177_9SPHN|nr:TonB-dependent siderophore receptor [Novosphingobium piscinae]MBC2670735.1 TonB-dependent siderophore receptor [Novosphingobium piscinae]
MTKLLLATATLALLPALAPAAAAAAAEDEANGPIIVTGHVGGYKADSSSSATRTDTPLIDVPQSITVVTRDRLDDQAQLSMAEVLRYVPGTTVGQGEGNRDQITLRGQNSTADFFLDGVRDDVQYYRGLYNIERVEVLKGPSALIFGRGGGGGVINRVQKTPIAGQVLTAANASVNSFGDWTVAADVNLPLAASTALRVNGEYEQLRNHRDFYAGERYAVNPTIGADLGRWKVGLSYEYVKDDRVTDRGVPSVATATGQPNTPLTGYRDTFFGVPEANRTGLTAHVVRARADGELTDNLTWSNTLLYGDYDKYYGNVFANGPANLVTGAVPLGNYFDATQRRNLIAQSNLVWKARVGAIENTLLLGLEASNQHTASQRLNGTLSATTLNLQSLIYPTVVFSTPARNTVSDVDVVSVYAQDQLGLGRHVDLLLGLRFDSFRITGTDLLGTPRPFARTDRSVSPRLGLVLKPRENVSIYGSFSKSFLPRSGEQFLSLSTTTQNLAPESFTNYEVGAKWDLPQGLSLTAAAFQLDRSNATTPDPTNPVVSINIGGTRTRGFEVGASGRILPQWQISGGYTFQDAHLQGNDAVRLAQVPRHQFALWNRYDLTGRLGAGVGVVHQSSQFAAIRTLPTTTLVPAFTRVDAAVYASLTPRIDLQVNIENVLNTAYFAAAHNNDNITPGAPRNARLTLRVKY